MNRTFRYPLLPNTNQEEILSSWLHSCASLYNGALEERISSYKKLGKFISYFDQCESLTEIRQDEYWKNIPMVFSRSALKRLDESFKGFFRRVKRGEKPGFPRFRASKRYDSMSFMSTNIPQIKDGSNKIRIPKLGLVKFHKYRSLTGTVKNIIIKRESDKWFISFICDLDDILKISNPKTEIGIDLGIKHFATLSNGEKIDNHKYLKTSEEVFKRRQRVLSRKKKVVIPAERHRNLCEKYILKLRINARILHGNLRNP